ncbi:Uncharacterised protein [Bordetella pertussis]|nr:Uncharacterised protein [Bordetella pertussis]CFP13125.1 Uncharacterised protein [Bordetella pertussis]CFU09535.1 Uncharacterised protein [Bordetella pertussis]CFW17924.1 Uncharacterised protein [Bordetella pertussis]CFW47907.1 Uncharacterised protein [Bordetella pertussis]
MKKRSISASRGLTAYSACVSDSGPCAMVWRMVRKLPSDFDILSASTIKGPQCIQTLASAPPNAPSVWAISFSWWGNFRSGPPPWISSGRPSRVLLMAEHSICQPGRPSP